MLDPNFNSKLKETKYRTLDTPQRKILISKYWIDMIRKMWLYVYTRKFFK